MDVELGFHELASGLRFQSCPTGDDSFERLPKALHVIGLRQYPERLVSEDFGEARKARRHDRDAAGQRLDDGDREALHLPVPGHEAWKDEYVDAAEERSHLRLGQASQKAHSGGDAELMRQHLQRSAQPPVAHQLELDPIDL